MQYKVCIIDVNIYSFKFYHEIFGNHGWNVKLIKYLHYNIIYQNKYNYSFIFFSYCYNDYYLGVVSVVVYLLNCVT